jgi:hypothetical protein
MVEKPRPTDVVIWTVSPQGLAVESFEVRTIASGLIERFEGSWPDVLERGKKHAMRRGVDVWKQDRDSYRRVWTFAPGASR